MHKVRALGTLLAVYLGLDDGSLADRGSAINIASLASLLLRRYLSIYHTSTLL